MAGRTSVMWDRSRARREAECERCCRASSRQLGDCELAPEDPHPRPAGTAIGAEWPYVRPRGGGGGRRCCCSGAAKADPDIGAKE